MKNAIILLALTFLLLTLITDCKKDPSPSVTDIETGTVTDIEGNVYKTVKIGNQWWMAENLNVKKYRNGKSIPKIDDISIWTKSVKGSYCIYGSDGSGSMFTNVPGLLYNWYAVSDTNNIAPAGWHVPSDDEWKELEKNLGMSQTDVDKMNWRGNDEGDKLKMEYPNTYWLSNDYTNSLYIWGTNESGFTAEAGGCRMYDGSWSSPLGIGFMGFWWSSTLYGGNYSWYRYLDYKNKNVFRFYGPNTYGFSIRCVKD